MQNLSGLKKSVYHETFKLYFIHFHNISNLFIRTYRQNWTSTLSVPKNAIQNKQITTE